MVEKNITQEFRLKNTDKTKNYFIKETNQNELMSKKQKKVCTTLNYIENLLILASAIILCVSITDFVSLVGISIGIVIFALGLKICAINAGIKKCKLLRKKKHDKLVLLAKAKLNGLLYLNFYGFNQLIY